ncbi:MAG: RNA methyltransferase [Chloroflexota bacterium]|nr:RNA methyltransferase [Chloroflexota bacterium]
MPSPERAVISSSANPAIAYVRSLSRRDTRAAERAFVVEGLRAVRDGLLAGERPRLVLLRQDERSELLLRELDVAPDDPVLRRVEPRLFDKLSEVQAPQGVLAVFPWPEIRVPDTQAPLVLVLDRLRDPGNLGTLLRSAAGAGVSAVYLTPESVDPWNAKVVRAGMGAHFRLPLLAFDAAAASLRQALPLRAATAASAPVAYDAVDWTQPAALIIGGEAEGVSPQLTSWASEAVAIPLVANVESLNAAVAGSILLFEAARQRRLEGG